MAHIYELLGIGECEEIEFKSAKGGVTKEIWPTYSAFANTHGGVIVLGVKEENDALRLSGLTREEAEQCKDKLWSQVRNKEVISLCLLSNEDVQIIDVDGSFVLTVRVPQQLGYSDPFIASAYPMMGPTGAMLQGTSSVPQQRYDV